MVVSRTTWAGVPLLLCVLLLAFAARSVEAVHTYITNSEPLCYIEDLPANTLVVAHYKVQRFNTALATVEPDPELGVFMTVVQTFDEHSVTSRGIANQGTVTFSSSETGEHRICFEITPPNKLQEKISQQNGKHKGIRFDIDFHIGESNKIESSDKDQLDSMAQRALDIVSRLQEFRREQVVQRKHEEEFRDMSESANSKALFWTVAQVVILVSVCGIQYNYLNQFFVKQKIK